MTRDYALELLGLSGTPDENELKKAYRELAKRVHPETTLCSNWSMRHTRRCPPNPSGLKNNRPPKHPGTKQPHGTSS